MDTEKREYIEQHFWDHVRANGWISAEQYAQYKDRKWTYEEIVAEVMKIDLKAIPEGGYK